jgi:hypothetical protein
MGVETNGLDGIPDFDWGNSESRRSTPRLLAQYNKSIVLWRSRTQKTITLSTTEADYYSAAISAPIIAVEIIYLRNLIRNISLPQDDDSV